MVHLILKEMKAEFKFISLHLSLRKEWISSHFLSTFCVQEAVNREPPRLDLWPHNDLHCNVTLSAYLRQVGMYTAQNYKQKQWSKLILFLGKNINLMDYCRSEKWAHKTNGQHCLQVLWSVWRQRLNSSSAIKAGRRKEENIDWEQKFKTGVREEKKSFKTPMRNEKYHFVSF